MAKTQSSSEIHDLIKRRLAEGGIRYSSGRHAVITAIQMAHGPTSAADLAFDSGSALPVSSLYRTLSIFEDAGILRRDHRSDGVARYELAEWLTGHHHHIICVSCGAIEDVELPKGAENSLTAIASTIAASTGFRVLNHVLEVEGVCSNCA